MPAPLADAVARAAGHPGHGRPVVVGFSGGLDSTVLLHLLATDAATHAAGLRALHVHHGLQADADVWAAHCRGTCDALGVSLDVVHVEVARDAGLGLEGAARDARHRAFADAMRDGDVLALAHHRDDQAETFLLRALRGSGVDGLAAMRPWRVFAGGVLWRPLLDLPRDALAAHAATPGLRWIEDPSNADGGLDRGFLRSAVMPLLRTRWPHADAMFARSAMLSAQAARLLDAEDAATLAAVGEGATLRIDALRALPAARRARVLRRWIAALDLPPLPAQGVAAIEHMLHGPVDANPRFDWSGARLQRWRDLLHAGTLRPPLPADWSREWYGRDAVTLPTGDRIALLGADGCDAPLRLHARQGGERIRLSGRTHSHALKHVLQDQGVPPWQRERLPLLSRDGELLAAGDAILAADMAAWLAARGARLQWTTLA